MLQSQTYECNIINNLLTEGQFWQAKKSAERPTFARLYGCCALLWSQPQSLEERRQVGLDIPSWGGEKATAPKVTSKIWTISSQQSVNKVAMLWNVRLHILIQ